MFGISIYNPGTGGNHLVNLLNSNKIKDIGEYTKSRLHIRNNAELWDLTSPVDYVVIAPHMFHYLVALEKMPDLVNQAKVFLLDIPKEGTRCYQRIAEIYSAYGNGYELLFADLNNFYSYKIVTALNPKADVFLIDINKLWDPDPSVIIDHIESITPLVLDKEHCALIHNKWCEKVGLHSAKD